MMTHVKICPVCGTANKPDEFYCENQKCGASLDGVSIKKENERIKSVSNFLSVRAETLDADRTEQRGLGNRIVQMGDKTTVRDSMEQDDQNIKLPSYQPQIKPTVRDNAGEDTKEKSEAPISPSGSRGPWLPSGLSDRYQIVKEFEARGAESDAYLVEDTKKQLFFAKIYVSGNFSHVDKLSSLI
jgi:predicted nucleic acid-binding Zn ribbon protein